MRSDRHAIPQIAVEELAEEIWALREEDRNDLTTLLDGSKLDVPDDMNSKYRIILFYRGHW